MNIVVSDLKKVFGDKTAVDIPKFSIPSGEILGLVGNNGAGKTTFFRLILDLIKLMGERSCLVLVAIPVVLLLLILYHALILHLIRWSRTLILNLV